MKIRVKIPEQLVGKTDAVNHYVDDILLWGMEMGMDVEYYSLYTPPGTVSWRDRDLWAVFTVEADSSFMFILKWSATMHKDKKKNEI